MDPFWISKIDNLPKMLTEYFRNFFFQVSFILLGTRGSPRNICFDPTNPLLHGEWSNLNRETILASFYSIKWCISSREDEGRWLRPSPALIWLTWLSTQPSGRVDISHDIGFIGIIYPSILQLVFPSISAPWWHKYNKTIFAMTVAVYYLNHNVSI